MKKEHKKKLGHVPPLFLETRLRGQFRPVASSTRTGPQTARSVRATGSASIPTTCGPMGRLTGLAVFITSFRRSQVQFPRTRRYMRGHRMRRPNCAPLPHTRNTARTSPLARGRQVRNRSP